MFRFPPDFVNCCSSTGDECGDSNRPTYDDRDLDFVCGTMLSARESEISSILRLSDTSFAVLGIAGVTFWDLENRLLSDSSPDGFRILF